MYKIFKRRNEKFQDTCCDRIFVEHIHTLLLALLLQSIFSKTLSKSNKYRILFC